MPFLIDLACQFEKADGDLFATNDRFRFPRGISVHGFVGLVRFVR